MSQPAKVDQGFSLIELLVVSTIIAVLAGTSRTLLVWAAAVAAALVIG